MNFEVALTIFVALMSRGKLRGTKTDNTIIHNISYNIPTKYFDYLSR